ncbi:MAG TPA: efflux RND transporter periplasmic adaptor subunit [Bryobacteraceae bacterium]|nr:efflux RND transporter periplasmic adaptor subunit [Bryobacteraceae bacterium]
MLHRSAKSALTRSQKTKESLAPTARMRAVICGFHKTSILTSVLTIAYSAAALFVIGCSRGNVKADVNSSPAPVAVRVASARAADSPLEIAAIGNVEAIASIDVKSRITAPVIRVHFSEGQEVMKDELLFELDAETYNRQIAEIEANIAKDVATAKQSEANIAKDEVTLRNALVVAERSKQLKKEGILSQEQTELAVTNADAANASRDADRAALESATASERADRARLEQTRLLLGYTSIRAPVGGRAGAIAAKEGSLVKENDMTLVTILQTSPIYVSFSIPEDSLPEVRRHQASAPLPVNAVASDTKAAAGKLSFIDNTVDSATGTIRLKSLFENADRALWPGEFVNVKATLGVEHNRILVPSRAVQTGPDGKYVWVVKPSDSSASMRKVQVLRNYTPPGQAEQAVIEDGLKQGEQVVSEGQLRLSPGAHVRLLAANNTGGA